MARKFTFHGMEAEALKQLSLKDFEAICSSNVRRSLQRNGIKIQKLLKKLEKVKGKNKIVKTHVREMPIVPQMIDMHFKVYNGKEFAGHEKIAHNLKAKFYFAHPYRSCERAINENSNGLLRQYYPKKTDLRGIEKDVN